MSRLSVSYLNTGLARVKSLREAKGTTQQQLADAAGMNKFGLAKLEQGVTEPYWPTVLKLAKALNVDCTAFADCSDVKADANTEPTPTKPAATKAKSKKGKK